MSKSDGLSSSLIHGLIPKKKDDAEKYLEGWRRARADYENLHNRLGEERISARRDGVERTLRELLVVLDYFDAAFSSIPENIKDDQWVSGVVNIQKAFLNSLNNLGVKAIDSVDVPFDPTFHESLGYVTDEKIKEGNVAVIVAKGYEYEGKVLRPARVRVSKNN